MDDSWFFDKNFNDVSDDFFDPITYFDFPLEDVESNEPIEDWDSQFQNIPTPSTLFTDFSSGICDQNRKDSLKLKKGAILSDESSQPKPCLGAAEASSSRKIPLNYGSSESKHPHLFWTTSPVSVLESSSSSSSAENPTVYHPNFVIPVKRPRSKCARLRRRTFPFLSLLNDCPSWAGIEEESESLFFHEQRLHLAKQKQKKRKNLMTLSCNYDAMKPSSSHARSDIRKCTHCEVTKTPQWREGPMGPKTLCNACGVRFRSGRLYPEYRPAASPTFVPALHSNSHRKVTEMRKTTIMPAMNTALPQVPEYSF
ncbi:GATA transcription factor 11-like [Mercurialis annua]|uniref:GATA transcription factor 11-like n=1 Tax=Mercurialis annua TaxID=3986 RepID=UPI00215F16E5|nr:GATA transcription factor 11-like [Mercurialis annua]